MSHSGRNVVLVVEVSCSECDRRARNNLFDEHNTSAPAIRRLSANVKPQIHFVKIAMERNWNAQNASVKELKTDDAQVCFAAPLVQFSSSREIRQQHLWLGLVIQHRQVSPFGREEGSIRHALEDTAEWL
jgi:hypothetical protein